MIVVSGRKGMSHAILMRAGYNNFSVNQYQLEITDDNGTRYFIDCERFEFSQHKLVMWEFSAQIAIKNGCSVDINLVQWFNYLDGEYAGNRCLRDVHDIFDYQWHMNGENYYELNGG